MIIVNTQINYFDLFPGFSGKNSELVKYNKIVSCTEHLLFV